ncbi:MAG TPA: helicase RepA family protein, partial [Geminicoccaceae bacterium]
MSANTADFLDELAKKDPKAAERLRKAEAAAKGHSTRLTTVWADDIEIRLDRGGLVDGLLSSTGMTVLYGESGCGKTFVAVDLGCHIAAGLPWRGMAVEQGVVVYVAAESPESVKKRLWAWKRRHGVDRLPVLVVQSAVDLLNGDTDALAGLLERLKAEHGRIALVVVDTLARAMTGNENAPDDMGRFVAACGRLRDAGEAHVMVVHHCGKDAARGARGHSSLRAATDVELEVTNGEGGGSVKVTKERDEASGTSYGFRLEQVHLGTNAKGRVVTTCVAVEADAPSGTRDRPGQSRLSPSGKIAAQALRDAVNAMDERPPDHEMTRDVRGAVRLTTWRRYFTQTYGNEAEDAGKEAERKAWTR